MEQLPVMKCLTLLFGCLLALHAGSARADERANRVDRLSRLIAESRFGEIGRTQAVLTLLCERPGTATALREPSARALAELMIQGKASWKDGDTPELMHALALAMNVNYAQGIKLVVGGKSKVATELREAVCRASAEKADTFLEAPPPKSSEGG
ncbi:hypothetical protein [Lysobacter sp. N42]|uniref:hypothetical protein n=1 Tax=Lysobacter sp. N42 TaxID=2545719 RepID=UPI0010482956|nr:hypothetical protein [Lysobacter sp. N42]TCZ77670.1 hypothetical protein EYQ95_25995 [Lysobacter sp. N42]